MLVRFNDFNRLFDPFWSRPFTFHARDFRGGFDNGWPRVSVEESDHAFIFTAELPGLGPEDVKVTFENGVLTLAGERAEEAPEGYELRRRERFSNRFERRWRLGSRVDPSDTEASFKDGVLTVTVPKAEAAKPLQIEVKA